jgi:hypothetical protein
MIKGSLFSTDFDETTFPTSLHSDISPSVSPRQGNNEEKYGFEFYLHPELRVAFTALFVTILASTHYSSVDISFMYVYRKPDINGRIHVKISFT